jgi:hypothetical protein
LVARRALVDVRDENQLASCLFSGCGVSSVAAEEIEMTKRTRIAITLGIVVFIILGGLFFHFYLSRSFAFWHTHSTDLSSVRPGGYHLGQNLDDKAFQGKTMSKINNALYDYEKLDQGVTIAANKERKLKTFGESYYKRKDEQSAEPVTGYVDRQLDMTTEFWSSQGVITEIRIDRTFME